ncbi:unnamed protein product (macronuclear) [Paramecium tetraurelia]|uniref:Phospholipid scramblase n=1 Tax=Paramecium tetraurelia TaxID=5888 RepID=A0CGW1_PARTE|nr:uncharacterized protein GSPATT00007468001 [Paramecium tetraurelia]CAK70028.1 unnamed protein product [Paramecium tetraurelia]|eukprot:XP_001437425.1 hypothetical protein (macronuclear) [Paramecium tetraurelia strain d4-2]
MQYHYPQAQYYPQQNYVSPMQMDAGFNSGLDALSRCPSVFIKQRPDYLETLGVCEKKNAYFVYQSDSMGNKPDFKQQAPIFKCKEESSCWQRNCLPGACRAFDLKVKQYNERQDTNTVFRMSREFRCTCLCFERPEMEVQLSNGVKIGTINYPFMFCDKGVDILDENNQIVYTIRGSCCQWPFLVNLPCETCQRARFDIMDSQGQKISELWKESAGFCNALCDVDATNFRLLFPMQASSRQKALLLAAALFIDFNYFEESPQDKQNNQF